MRLKAKASGVREVAQRMRKLSANLRAIVDGEAFKAAAEFTQGDLSDRAARDFDGHNRSGNAASTMLVRIEGRRVWLDWAYYLKFHSWWDEFRNGFPADLAKLAGEKYRDEARRILRGD